MRSIVDDVVDVVSYLVIDKKIDEKLSARFGCVGALLIVTLAILVAMVTAALVYHFWVR